jgi:HNH endonuclease
MAQDEFSRTNPRDRRVVCYCRWCGRPFLLKRSKVARGHGRYCSKEHADAGRLGLLVDRMRDGLDVSGGPDACWLWVGAVGSRGYGTITLGLRNGRPLTASTHRTMWRLLRGEIPPGLSVLHRCDNRRCCNPRHLFLGTHRDNMRDMSVKGRSGRRRLTDGQVLQLRARAAAGETWSALARAYGLTLGTVQGIVQRRTYQYI